MYSSSRRNAIRKIALGGSTVLLSPGILWSAACRKKERLGVALVGLGYYSTDLLAPALQQTRHCYLAGIVTGTPSKAVTWQEKYHLKDSNIYNYQNFDQIASNDDIDVVYVVLPPSMHREYVERAARAGKHVWCEKPMAVTATDCEAMIKACKSNKRSLAIGYRLHHEPNTQEYRRLIKSGQLGKLKSLSCAAGYYDSRTTHWKQKKEMGGGALLDMGVYSIQGARLGTGMEPLAVAAATLYTTRPEVYKDGLEETAVATLEFPGNILAQIKTSFGENINYLTVTGEKGELNMKPFSGYDGLQGSSPQGLINHPYKAPWQQSRQMDDDALAIMQGKPVLAPGEEGLRDIRIVEAIKQAAAQNRRIVL